MPLFIGARGAAGVRRGQAWRGRSGARRGKVRAGLSRRRPGEAREHAGEDGGGRGSFSSVDVVRHGGGKTATMATATALARARERVWRVAVV